MTGSSFHRFMKYSQYNWAVFLSPLYPENNQTRGPFFIAQVLMVQIRAAIKTTLAIDNRWHSVIIARFSKRTGRTVRTLFPLIFTGLTKTHQNDEIFPGWTEQTGGLWPDDWGVKWWSRRVIVVTKYPPGNESISHLWEKKNHLQTCFGWDMLVPKEGSSMDL